MTEFSTYKIVCIPVKMFWLIFLKIDESRINCAKCDKKFHSNHDRIKHEHRCSGDDTNPYMCNMCGETYKHKSYLKDHNKRV